VAHLTHRKLGDAEKAATLAVRPFRRRRLARHSLWNWSKSFFPLHSVLPFTLCVIMDAEARWKCTARALEA